MTTAVMALVSLAALLGILGVAAVGTALFRKIRFPIMFIPLSLMLIAVELLLGAFFGGMTLDALKGGVSRGPDPSWFIWAVPFAAASLAVIWLVVLDIRSLLRNR